MLLKLAIVYSLLGVVFSRTHITDCLDANKYCVGLPRGCVGTSCAVSYSSISNGDQVEIEIFGRDILDKTWIAIAYSEDKMMKNDYVVYCIRDDKGTDITDIDQMGGLAFNTNHNSENIGTISSLKKNGDDKFNLKMVEYEKDESTLYCRMRHNVKPIIDKFNVTKVEILMSKGVWIKNHLSYHGKTRNSVGIVDLSGDKKKSNSATDSLALLSSVVTVFVRLFL